LPNAIELNVRQGSPAGFSTWLVVEAIDNQVNRPKVRVGFPFRKIGALFIKDGRY
jgi:hypothetical protein